MVQRSFLGGAWLLIVCGLLSSASAHPFHISTAEVEYDGESDRLQVGLRIQALDLEQALTRMVGSKWNIEQPESTQQLIKYLSQTFYVSKETKPTFDKAASIQHHFVGRELKGAWLWVYFEIELPQSRHDLRLFDTVLFETNERQINTVVVRHNAERVALKLTRQQPAAMLDPQWLKPN